MLTGVYTASFVVELSTAEQTVLLDSAKECIWASARWGQFMPSKIYWKKSNVTHIIFK